METQPGRTDASNEVLIRIGEKLREMRIAKGYQSHEYFAHDANLPRVQYWRIEKGKTNVTMRSLCRILAIHGVLIEDFFASFKKGINKVGH